MPLHGVGGHRKLYPDLSAQLCVLLCQPQSLDAQRQPFGQGGGEPFGQDLPLGFLDVVVKPVELDDPRLRVVDGTGSAGIPVPRLADRARVDEVADTLLELHFVRLALDEGALDNTVFLHVDEGEMSMAEKAERSLDMVEGLGGVKLPEDIVVLVERRAVADGDRVVEELRTLLLAEEVIVVLLQNFLFGPENSRGGDGVERLDGVQAADGFVVVSADHGQGLQGLDPLDDLVGRSSIADHVAEEDVVVNLLLLDKLEHGQESFLVPVDVGEGKVAHGFSAPPGAEEWNNLRAG